MTEAPQDNDFRRLAMLFAIATVAVLYAASFAADARLWGVNWYRYFGWAGPVVLLLVGLAVPLYLLRRPLREPSDDQKTGGDFRFTLEMIASLPVAGVIFFLLRSQTFFLGDGYQVLHKVQQTAQLVKTWDTVTFALQRAVFHLTGLSGEAGGLIALWAISVGCGLVFLAVVGAASLYLFADNRDRRLFTFGIGSGGYCLLFFGYIENYPLFVLTALVFVVVGLLVARGALPRWAVAPAALLPLLLHPFAVAMLPAAGYLLVREKPIAHRWLTLDFKLRCAVVIFIAACVVVAGYLLYERSYFFRFALVPFVPDRFTVEGYWLFSGKHLLDLVNLVFMLFPGVLLLALLLWWLRRTGLFKRPEYRFLLLFLVPALVLVVVVNPRLGMPRDWDLLSFAGIPLVVLFFLAALDNHPLVGRLPRGLAVAALLLGALVLAPRVLTQASPSLAIQHLDYLCRLDVARCRSGRFLLEEYYAKKGRFEERRKQITEDIAALPETRWVSQAAGMVESGDYARAIDKLRQATARDPLNPYAWRRLATVYTLQRKYDSAFECLKIADGINPLSFVTYMQLARATYGLGDLAMMESYLHKALAMEPGDLEATANLAAAYLRQGREDDFQVCLNRAAKARNVTRAELALQMVDYELETDNRRNAAFWLRQGLKDGLDSAVALQSHEDIYRSLDTVSRAADPTTVEQERLP